MKAAQRATLSPQARLDSKWIKSGISAIFTKDGLHRLWNELLKDGEVVLSQGEPLISVAESSDKSASRIDSNSNSSVPQTFISQSVVDQWTWGHQPDGNQLREALRGLLEEQRELAWQAAGNTPSAQRLQMRLAILSRYFLALSRHQPTLVSTAGSNCGTRQKKRNQMKERAQSQLGAAENVSQRLARVGSGAVISFMFSFLKRAWRLGEDTDMCSELLQESLSTMLTLYVPSLYDESGTSSIWVEVVDKVSKFLRKVITGELQSAHPPLEDRQTALALLLEICVQRASLGQLLEVLLLLLQLPEKLPGDNVLSSAPVVPILKQLAAIRETSVKSLKKPVEAKESVQSMIAVSPTQSFLQYFTLPDDDVVIDLKQAALIILCHIDKLAESYKPDDDDDDQKTGSNASIYAWGGLNWSSSNDTKTPESCDWLSELSLLDVYCAEKQVLITTQSGKVYTTVCGAVAPETEQMAPKLVAFPEKTVVTKVACHVEGKHFLALSSTGDIYSWGNGDGGKLGHGDSNTCNSPKLIAALHGMEVVNISCGNAHSCAVTRDGQLYTWGKGTYGRLGHGSCEDCNVPTLVEALRGKVIVDVACGGGDAQTLALQDNGCVFSWGDGDYGKLGRGGSDGCKSPKPVDRLDGEDIIQVGCGTQFSAALSSKGRVFTWGKGDGHRLGHGTEEHVRYPKRVEGALLNKHVISLSVGCMHCAVVTEDGEVYCWGRNDRSQQGDGSTNTKTIPTLVGGLQDTPMMKVACGAHQTFVWSTVSSWGHGVRAPFCIDVKQSTFQFLDVLLKQVCTGLDKWHDWRPPRQEQECMAVAGLNLLGLQELIQEAVAVHQALSNQYQEFINVVVFVNEGNNIEVIPWNIMPSKLNRPVDEALMDAISSACISRTLQITLSIARK